MRIPECDSAAGAAQGLRQKKAGADEALPLVS
jgi:hypothetical protein